MRTPRGCIPNIPPFYCTGIAMTHTNDDTAKQINEASAEVPWLFYDPAFELRCKVELASSPTSLGDRFWSLVQQEQDVLFLGVLWLAVYIGSFPKKRANRILTSLSGSLQQKAVWLLGWVEMLPLVVSPAAKCSVVMLRLRGIRPAVRRSILDCKHFVSYPVVMQREKKSEQPRVSRVVRLPPSFITDITKLCIIKRSVGFMMAVLVLLGFFAWYEKLI
jgi:hypothetical protein